MYIKWLAEKCLRLKRFREKSVGERLCVLATGYLSALYEPRQEMAAVFRVKE